MYRRRPGTTLCPAQIVKEALMARTKQIGATQFKDLSPWGKAAAIVAGIGGIAAGYLLPMWITLVGIAVVFLTAFLVQKARGKI
jgi:hypothetical protein